MNNSHPAYADCFTVETAKHRADLLTNETGIEHTYEETSNGIFRAIPVAGGAEFLTGEQIPPEVRNKPKSNHQTESQLDDYFHHELNYDNLPEWATDGYIEITVIENKIGNPQFPDIVINPEKPNAKPRILATIPNLRYLLKTYGIRLEYDEILKRRSIVFASHGTKGHDIEDEASLSVITSLCVLNGLGTTALTHLPALFAENTVNPVIDWIKSKPWDGIDRKQQLFNTLTVAPEDENYRNQALNIWLIQCVAAADNGEIGHKLNPRAVKKFELVLILQGKQGFNKTTWLGSILPDSLCDYFKDGMHLDTKDKDSIKKCISSWITELGEIDATFRKSDIAQLKAFLSNQTDEIRLPYDRTSSKFKRRTSFAASVNSEQFLTDATGSRRFIPVQVLGCDGKHNLDMQQIWAQYWCDYINGAQWWTTPEFDVDVKVRNEKHNEVSAIGEMVAMSFNVNSVDMAGAVHLTPTNILVKSGICVPTRPQVKEITEFLVGRGFRYKQAFGIRGFTIYEYPKESSYSNNGYRNEW